MKKNIFIIVIILIIMNFVLAVLSTEESDIKEKNRIADEQTNISNNVCPTIKCENSTKESIVKCENKIGSHIFHLPETNNCQIRKVTSNSMCPVFCEGNNVECCNYNENDLKVGNIVCYDNKTCHRIISINGDIFTVKGDNNYWNETINKNQITCLVKGVEFA